MTLSIVGLGPAGLERLSDRARALLGDPARTVIVRTRHHPAAESLASKRAVVSCDDVYETAADFDAAYQAIVTRVLDAAAKGPVVYAVPGSAVVGERAAAEIRIRGAESGIEIELVPGESFLDLAFARTGLDPIVRGVQVVDARELPDPLPLHLPTIVTQVDRPEVVADLAAILGRVLPHDTPVTILDRLGSPDEVVKEMPLSALAAHAPGPRTSLYVDPPPVGWHGLVTTNRRLRAECPWDREQTHHSLVSHLIEETYETVEAVAALGPEAPGGEIDYGAYADLEEELGDLLLQVVFHATLAAETGAFGVEEVAEAIRRKLVHRHPHVFGEVEADTAEVVKANWEALKAGEKGRASLMDDVPDALPAIGRAEKLQTRAASVGFDWDDPAPVLAKLHEEIEELGGALAGGDAPDRAAVHEELGDVLFAVVNLSRHLELDPELALRRAADKFADRFRAVEEMATAESRDLGAMTLAEMDELWERVKQREGG